jgi:hypothetical protein
MRNERKEDEKECVVLEGQRDQCNSQEQRFQSKQRFVCRFQSQKGWSKGYWYSI